MKKILLLLFFSITYLYIFPQTWSTPVSLTDSLTDNRNTAFIFLPDFYDGPDYYIFWERSVDSTYTDIYVKKYYENSDPIPVLSDSIHHFRNPMVFNINYFENIFGLIYESDQNGNIDLFCIIYTVSGFKDPIQITISSSDDTHARFNRIGDLVWERDTRIYYSHFYINNLIPPFFTVPKVISEAECHHPQISQLEYANEAKFVSWEKDVPNGTIVEYVFQNNYDTTWSEVEILFNDGDNSHLSFSNTGEWGDWPLVFCDRAINDSYQIIGYEFYTLADYESIFSQSIPYMPTSLVVPLVVDDIFMSGFLSFVKEEDQSTDIYAGEYLYYFSPYIESYENVSDSPEEDTYPQVFWGKWSGCWVDFPLIWESRVNGHWQLKTSIASDCLGGIDNNAAETNVDIYPNPGIDHINLSHLVFMEKETHIEIIDSRGRIIKMQNNPKGADPCRIGIADLPPGIYLALIYGDNECISSSKLIIQ